MAKIVQEIEMGDYTISLKDHGDGKYEARLSSGRYGGLLEIEKSDYGLRIRQIDIGSADVSLEHLALMTILVGADQELISEINRINKARNQSWK
ncbi:hypothetical protein EV207_13015 [Scopulibacillus darangshiensis]|uniref:Uncharacterized protein n=1 Tax=Scopulibacillus darangshiensis TaxID=442528 RepID=A0A4R2NQ49_9BACL|nr:hypothetical protein [Scopulibacillus darangshiensis]TCP23498.1 hypothetical protein EV207_13015 [Scopulibacillus darangshiensis]